MREKGGGIALKNKVKSPNWCSNCKKETDWLIVPSQPSIVQCKECGHLKKLPRAPARIDEMYEKLVQIYEVRHDYGSPRMMLEYRIRSAMVKGRTREEAIKALYEKEGELTHAEKKKHEKTTKQQIDDYERSIERLTTLFSKGEISEDSYKTAIRTIEKNMPKLRKETTTSPSRSSYTPYVEKPSSWWYLVPLLFGLLGGILAYIAVKDEDKNMATSLLTFGICMFFIDIIVIWAIYAYYISLISSLY